MSGTGTAAEVLRARRRAAGLSQEQLAERCHLSERTIRTLESGQAKRPHTRTLGVIAAALGLTDSAVDDFVASWRESTPDQFISAQAREDSVAQELIRQRRGLRDIATSHTVVIGKSGLWQRSMTTRTVVAVEPGVSTFAWMAGLDPESFDPELMRCDNCVNIEFRSATVLPIMGTKAFVGSFGRELSVGETRTFGYEIDFTGSHVNTHYGPGDLELLFAAGSGTELLVLEVRFEVPELPERVFAVRRDAAEANTDGDGHEMLIPVSTFGFATHVVRPVASSVYGLRWEWAETS